MSQLTFDGLHFDGKTYDPTKDAERLRGQTRRVFLIMWDGEWRTLAEIHDRIGERFDGQHDSEASVSARLRDLRKERFGGHTIDRRRRGEGTRGLHEYRLTINPEWRTG